MKHLSNTKKMMAALGAGLLVTAASGTAFAMQTREAHDLRATIEVQQKANERHGQPPATAQASPQPAPALPSTAEPHDEIEFTGPVEVIASDMWVVGSRTLIVTADTEIKPGLEIGGQAKVHAVTQADGSLWAREIEPADGDHHNGNSNENENSNDNSNDNHNGNVNSNDDNGNDDDDGNVNSNDDNGNDDDDGNVNSNDDHVNDDHDGNVNSNDNDSNDDHDGNGSNVNSNDGHGNDGHGDNHNGNGNPG